MIHILIAAGVFVLVAGIIYMIRAFRQSKRDARKALDRVDAHVRALGIINDPDLYDVCSGGAELTLVEDVGDVDEARPEAVDPLSATIPRHSVGVAAVVAVAVTASFVALIWLAVVPEPPTALKLPVPPPITSVAPAPSESTVSPTGRPAAAIVSTATIEPSPAGSHMATTPTARSSSSARPTAAASRSQPTSPTPATTAPSVPGSGCAVGVQSVDGVRFPCIVK